MSEKNTITITNKAVLKEMLAVSNDKLWSVKNMEKTISKMQSSLQGLEVNPKDIEKISEAMKKYFVPMSTWEASIGTDLYQDFKEILTKTHSTEKICFALESSSFTSKQKRQAFIEAESKATDDCAKEVHQAYSNSSMLVPKSSEYIKEDEKFLDVGKQQDNELMSPNLSEKLEEQNELEDCLENLIKDMTV